MSVSRWWHSGVGPASMNDLLGWDPDVSPFRVIGSYASDLGAAALTGLVVFYALGAPSAVAWVFAILFYAASCWVLRGLACRSFGDMMFGLAYTRADGGIRPSIVRCILADLLQALSLPLSWFPIEVLASLLSLRIAGMRLSTDVGWVTG
jgi:hypothetical protein